MSRKGNQNTQEQQGDQSLEDRMAILFDELELALKWQRPSILLVMYESEFVRQDAEAALQELLSAIGQSVYHFRVSEKQYDVPTLLAHHPARDKTIFFVSGLKWGGGKGGYNAYRALNLHREAFVENQIRAVFWLSKKEAAALPRHAPDFWAFRHRVIELTGLAVRSDESPAAERSETKETRSVGSLEDIDARIAFREAALATLPDNSEALPARLELMDTLASLYRMKGDYQKSIDLLKQGLSLADHLQDKAAGSKFWLGLGLAAQDMNNINSAISAYKKATELNPRDAAPWNNLACAHRSRGHPEDALLVCQKAIELNPQAAAAWNNLGNIHLDLGQFDEARRAYQHATKIEAETAEYWKNLGKVYRNLFRNREAIHALRKAVKTDAQDAESWNMLGQIYQSAGRLREAIRAYYTAVELDPENDSARSALSACKQTSRESDAARRK